MKIENELTPRIEKLLKELKKRGVSDRSGEWFRKEDLPNIAVAYPKEHVILRRAYAIDAMLKSMCNSKKFGYTNCYKIEDGDLFAGVLPMASNGLGKVFPNYLTNEELRVGSVTNKTAMALLGHNTINYEKVLSNGLQSIIDFCNNKLAINLKADIDDAYNKNAFYLSVKISCQAVIDYAKQFADLATDKAKFCKNQKRKEELLEIARICNKVPAKPADTYYEALHSIWLVHCCLHSSMDFMSLGRLDQVLNPYLKKEKNKDFARELFENFIIKAAYRLNLTTQYLVEQDHMDYNAALGIHPYYLDQRAGLNNFLQNIIIGGKTPQGTDATNECTYIILKAFENVNLSTPGIYVRLHKNSPSKLRLAVAQTLSKTKTLPSILNDEVMIPAMRTSLSAGETDSVKLKKYKELANDYCVDGCWEPILNGVSEWTFGMINGMTILECALNRGAALTSNLELLRGQKLSKDTGAIKSYNDLEKAMKEQIQFFVDQSTLAMCLYYMTSEFVVPSPLVSALFGACLEKGRDKSWGGADYNLGGTVLGGVPEMVNTFAAIKKWVFNKKKYQFSDVVSALRYNFTASDYKTQKLFDSIKVDFRTNSPQFGNTEEVEPITKFMLTQFNDSVKKSKVLSYKVFLNKEGDTDPQVWALRAIAGYYGKSLKSTLPDFDLKFTSGLGTFEQYNWQGAGNAASATRNQGDPLAPNFTPASGTWQAGVSNLLEMFSRIDLKRFAAGVITDICLDELYNSVEILESILKMFVEKQGGMMTLTIGSAKEYQQIYELAKAAGSMENRKAASEELAKYSNIVVRVGGWNAPFITLPLSHMENYVNRPVKA